MENKEASQVYASLVGKELSCVYITDCIVFLISIGHVLEYIQVIWPCIGVQFKLTYKSSSWVVVLKSLSGRTVNWLKLSSL